MNQDELRALALSLPEAVEQPHFERASFRVNGKIFATLPPGGELVVLLRLPVLIKESLQQTDSRAIVSLGAWERPGVIQLAIGRMDPAKLADLVRLAWREAAPKRLRAGT